MTDRKPLQGAACAMRHFMPHERRGAGMTGRETDKQAQALRDSAAALLQEAAASGDLALRDALTRKALIQIAEARRLLDEAEVSVKPRPTTRLH